MNPTCLRAIIGAGLRDWSRCASPGEGLRPQLDDEGIDVLRKSSENRAWLMREPAGPRRRSIASLLLRLTSPSTRELRAVSEMNVLVGVNRVPTEYTFSSR